MMKPFSFTIFVALLALTLGVILQPHHAQASVLEFFFPSLRGDIGPDPSKTLEAPFAYKTQKANTEKKEATLEGDKKETLDTPHIMGHQIGAWLMNITSETTTFEHKDYQKTLDKNMHYFTPRAFEAYKIFLKKHSMQKALDSKRYILRSFVENTPILLNQGAVSGRYRWLYEVPVMVSYLDRNMKGYKTSNAINQKLVLNIQVGRTGKQDNLGVIIEHWDGRVVDVK